MQRTALAGSSEFRIFRVSSPRLLDRVSRFVCCHLALERTTKIDVESLGESKDEEEHIRQFVLNLASSTFILKPSMLLIDVEKAELLEQLGGLGDQSDREVLGRVKLVPIARLAESANLVLELLDRGHVFHVTHSHEP